MIHPGTKILSLAEIANMVIRAATFCTTNRGMLAVGGDRANNETGFSRESTKFRGAIEVLERRIAEVSAARTGIQLNAAYDKMTAAIDSALMARAGDGGSGISNIIDTARQRLGINSPSGLQLFWPQNIADAATADLTLTRNDPKLSRAALPALNPANIDEFRQKLHGTPAVAAANLQCKPANYR